MNSVIEQLAEEAAEEVVAYEHDVVLRVEHKEGAVLEVPADFIFKFAKLIVQECIDVVDVGGEFVSRPKMVERLKEHFGVEE